jgi:hypothetical protein
MVGVNQDFASEESRMAATVVIPAKAGIHIF